MANYLKLRDIKKHLNIDDYFTDDDIYIEALSNVAEKVVEKHIDLGLDIVADYNGGELPPPLIHAMLLFVGNMYANRESVAFASASEIPLSYQYILDLYKCYNPSNYSLAMTIIDNLTSNSTTDALSANQGRILKELIDNINVEVDLTNYYTKPQTDALMSTKSDVTHTHVIGQVADLQAKLDAKANVSDLPDVSQYLTEPSADNKYQPKGEYLTAIPEEYVTDTELTEKGYATTTQLEAKLDVETYNSDKATFALKSDIPTDYVTTETAEATYAKKTEIPDTSTLATKSELTEGLAGKANTNDLSNYLTTANAQSTYATKSEIPDTSDFVTTVQLNGKQDTLVSGTNIKTINGNSLLGEGNITIESPEGGITDAPNDGKLYGRKSTQWSEVVIPDTSNLATKTELGAKLDTSTYNSDKVTFATKEELNTALGTISTKLDEINGETIQ